MVNSLERLIRVLSRLPGIGKRTAERVAYRLVREQQGLIRELIAALEDAETQIDHCRMCGNVTEKDRNPCGLCTKPGRDDHLLCVVEEPGDIVLLEQSGAFNGRYFCLHGRLSPPHGDTVPSGRVRQLIDRLGQGGVQEVLLAMNSDMEGDATAAFLREQLSGLPVRITRLAFGIPLGSALMYTDPATLSQAVQGRRTIG